MVKFFRSSYGVFSFHKRMLIILPLYLLKKLLSVVLTGIGLQWVKFSSVIAGSYKDAR